MKLIDFGGLEHFLARLRETFAPMSHTHTVSQVSGLQGALDGKAAASHTHAASSITSGTLPVERGGTGVTSDDALRQKVLDYPDNDDLLEYLGLS